MIVAESADEHDAHIPGVQFGGDLMIVKASAHDSHHFLYLHKTVR